MSTTPELAAALSKFQGAVGAIHKSKTAKIDSKDPNKRGFVYKYADLASIAEAAYPELAKNGLSFAASPTMGERGFVLEYALMHESGENIAGSWPLPDPRNVDIKQIGIAITYARRYCFSAVTGIVTEEDTDTQGAPAPQQEQVGRPRPAAKTPAKRPPAQRPAWEPAFLGQRTPEQSSKMFAMKREYEKFIGDEIDRDEFLGFLSGWTGREIASTTELRGSEMQVVYEELQTMIDTVREPDGPNFPVDPETGEVR